MKGSDRGQFDFDGDAGDPGDGSRLDAYLDGQLSGAELSAFEARLASEPALDAQRELQQRIDRGLRGVLIPPAFIPLPMNGHPPACGTKGLAVYGHPLTPSAPPAGAAAKTGWAAIKSVLLSGKGLLISALLLSGLLGIAGWLASAHFTAVPAEHPRALSFQELYQGQVHAESCGANLDRQQVESLASQTLGYTIRLQGMPTDVKLVSMTNAWVMTHNTFVLHARHNGQDLLVLADHACEDVPASVAAAHTCGMHPFRREVDGLVFYELTPLEQPVLLNALQVLPAGTSVASPIVTSTATQPTTKP
jgi:anti-sigma factor RsiW